MNFFYNKKRRIKPRYKKLLRSRENIWNKKKIESLKKSKWEIFQSYCKKELKFFNKYRPLDQKIYYVTKHAKKGVAYKKRYRDTLAAARNFKLFYGTCGKRYFKKLIKTTLIKHTKKYKKINLKMFFLKMIESRLDVILFRSKFCTSIQLARQIIKHGKVKVNNKKIRSKFYLVKQGDLISIHKSFFFKLDAICQKTAWIKNMWPLTPNHLIINYKTLQIIFNEPTNEIFTNQIFFNLKLEKILLNYLKTQ